MNTPPLRPSDLYLTPPWILDLVEQVGPIALDPCPGPRGWTRAAVELRLDCGDDGLAPWPVLAVPGLVYVNPPYGRGHLDLWLPRIAEEARGDREIIALLPATPGPAWWQDHVVTAQAICFLRGRPSFPHPDAARKHRAKDTQTGTKDAAVVYWGDRARRFVRVFRDHGQVLVLPEQESAQARGRA